MAFHRRQHHHNHHRLRYLVPVISVTSGFLLLVALFSLFPPSPLDDHDHLHLPRRDFLINNGVDEARHSFHVPADGGVSERDIWSSSLSKSFYGCSNASHKFAKAEAITYPNCYLLIATSGGLNQQRIGITDSVVAARILNATLVVPKLDEKSFWKDSSNFSEIFDVDWFISYLSQDVKIIKELPLKGGRVWIPQSMRIPRKCNEKCYQMRLVPVLSRKHAVELTKFDYRLSNKLGTELQKLRCRVNYHALKFIDPILEMGKKLVQRMRMRSEHYIALHLRFEPDMLSFSGCYYGGGEKERRELGKLRRRWNTLRKADPDKGRRQGRCPLTPEEVGLMLRALGYGKDVHIYVASGEIYGGEETLAPLKALFPNFHSKDTIASKEELEPFSSFSSRMAALDFMVCDESDVFVTNNNGNMAKILAGRRRYFGHKPTIRPNAKKLYRLFSTRYNRTWEEFASKVCTSQKGFMGEPNEVRPGSGVFHENPASCICEDSGANTKMDSGPSKLGKENSGTRQEAFESVEDSYIDDDWSDPEDDLSGSQVKSHSNMTHLDYEGITSEDPEVEALLSD